jgi:hypothetical protein
MSHEHDANTADTSRQETLNGRVGCKRYVRIVFERKEKHGNVREQKRQSVSVALDRNERLHFTPTRYSSLFVRSSRQIDTVVHSRFLAGGSDDDSLLLVARSIGLWIDEIDIILLL